MDKPQFDFSFEPDEPDTPDNLIEQDLNAAPARLVQPFGAIRLEQHAITVQPAPAAPVHMTTSADDALRYALSRRENCVITGHLFAGNTFSVFPWRSPVVIGQPLVLEFEAVREVCLLVTGGETVYMPSHPYEPAARWVQLSRAREYYALGEEDRDDQRQQWIARLLSAAPHLSSLGAPLTESWLASLSMPALRLLMAYHAASVFSVWRVDQPDRQFRGAAVGSHDAVTLPLPRYPIAEPDCYLPVIAGREGRIEAVNAYDLEAGISLGPIQFNAHGGALLHFLWMLWKRDPDLFAQEFTRPLGWTMRADSTHPDLVLAEGLPGEVALHGRDEDTQRNAGYFQSGVPGQTGFADIDPAFRESLTVRFRNVVAWPHVQELILNTCAWWLAPGLDALHDARYGIPRLNPLEPDRDTFVLKALLLSAHVRYAACLWPFLEALRRWDTPQAKRRNWHAALDAAGPWGNCTPSRRGRLRARLDQQVAEAEATFDLIERIAAQASGEGRL
ncbi:MAG: hypothetical protein IT325_09130 [Anaerolineae bacterium]|nr:hypothetical protein [Anaerolineae bacterium]